MIKKNPVHKKSSLNEKVFYLSFSIYIRSDFHLIIHLNILKMGLIKEFKTFAMKGNVVDMAVGIIIGAAFGKIVSSFVNDVLMPPLGLLLGGVNFTDFKFIIHEATVNQAGDAVAAVSINYGNFIQVTIDFLIVAFAVFMMIKAMNATKKKEAAAPAPAPPPPSKEEVLLGEIRDLLKKQ